jgi:hypothetical protein
MATAERMIPRIDRERMEDEIIRKIKAELELGIKTESQVVYLLVEVRKLLDKRPTSFEGFTSLRLYCDWAVHERLSSNRLARDVVKRADTLAAQFEKPDAQLEEEFKLVFSWNAFREDLSQFLEKIGLLRFSERQWHIFLARFLNVIEECPLLCKGKDVSVIDEIVVVRNKRDADGSPPLAIWALCSNGEPIMTYGGTWEEWEKEVKAAVLQFYKSRE